MAISAPLWIALALMALAGFLEVLFLTTNTTPLQLSIPDEVRGRVSGIAGLMSGMPVGAFIPGEGSDLVGPRAMSLVFGMSLTVVAGLVYFGAPVIRDYRSSNALEDM